MKQVFLGIILLAVTMVIGPVFADSSNVVVWNGHPDGTTHYYQVINEPADWQTAKEDAESRYYQGMPGCLAMVTSKAEHDFIKNNLWISGKSMWIGGYQSPSGSEPDGGWQWIAGPDGNPETWDYTDSFSPDDSPNKTTEEDCLDLTSGNGNFNDGYCEGEMIYLVEYSAAQVPVTTSHSITATAGNGGIISPSGLIKVDSGKNQTFTFIPLDGYQISDVLIDGVSQGPASSYTFTGVVANHNLSVIFRAVSNPGEIPDAPVLSVVTNGTQVTLSWTQVSNATGYTLLFAPYPDVSYIGQIDMKTQTSVSFTLWEGLAFYVAVRAHNSFGFSNFSNIVYFIIHEASPVDNSRFYGNFYGMNVTGSCANKIVLHFGNSDDYKTYHSYEYLPIQGSNFSSTVYSQTWQQGLSQTWTIQRNLSISGNTISVEEHGTSDKGNVWSLQGTLLFSSDYSKVNFNGLIEGGALGLCTNPSGSLSSTLIKADCSDSTPPYLISTEARPGGVVAFNFSTPMSNSSWWYSTGCGSNQDFDYWEDLNTYIVSKPTCGAGDAAHFELRNFMDVCGNLMPETNMDVFLK